MRVHIENTQAYLQAFAGVLAKDPMSLNAWQVVHARMHMNKEHPYFKTELFRVLPSLRDAYKASDCEIVVCHDHDLLFISHELDAASLSAMATELMNALHAEGEKTVYTLPQQWRELAAMLKDKQVAVPAPSDAAVDAAPDAFGELASLTDVFAEACLRRKARNPMHVLLVEDDALTRRVASTVFKQNYALITAKDAEDAIACYFSYAPDIVFLDINLPDADGFQVLQKIIANDSDAYVVMFSGNSYLDNITRALNSGAQGFVPKPFNRERMQHYVTDCALARQKHSG